MRVRGAAGGYKHCIHFKSVYNLLGVEVCKFHLAGLDSGNSWCHLGGKNVGVKIVKGNVLEVELNGPNFSFSADGFDELRDLFVRLDELSEPSEASSDLKLS